MLTRSAKDNIEVHAINANARVILNPQVYVLLNAKSKVASVGKVVFAQFILSYL